MSEQAPKSFSNEQSSYLNRVLKGIEQRLNDIIAVVRAFVKDGAILTANLANGAVAQIKLGTNVAGNGPLFSAHHTVANALAAGVYTKVIYNVEDFDTNNNYDPVTGVFTPTIAGHYLINANIQTDTTSTSHILTIWKNGAVYFYGLFAALNYGTGIHTVTAIVFMNGTTDFVDIRCFSTIAANTLNTNGLQTLFQGCLIRAA
jgi:hypothetical protein